MGCVILACPVCPTCWWDEKELGKHIINDHLLKGDFGLDK